MLPHQSGVRVVDELNDEEMGSERPNRTAENIARVAHNQDAGQSRNNIDVRQQYPVTIPQPREQADSSNANTSGEGNLDNNNTTEYGYSTLAQPPLTADGRDQGAPEQLLNDLDMTPFPVQRATMNAANEAARGDWNLAVFYFFLLAARNAAPSLAVFRDTINRLHYSGGRWRIALPAHGPGATPSTTTGLNQGETPAHRADNNFFDFEGPVDLMLSPQGQRLEASWTEDFMQGSAVVTDDPHEIYQRAEDVQSPTTPTPNSTARRFNTPDRLAFNRMIRENTNDSPASLSGLLNVSMAATPPAVVPGTGSAEHLEDDNVLRAREVPAEANTLSSPDQRTTPQRPAVSPITPSPDTTTEEVL